MPYISRSRLADLKSWATSYAELLEEVRSERKAAVDNSRHLAVQLSRAEETRRHLVEQTQTLQSANEAQARELLDLKTRVTP